MTYYSDIDLSLDKQRDGDIRKDIDIEAVKNSIRNIAETIQGHRVMRPEFAFNGYNMLFEPITKETGNIFGNLMWQSIERWEPRVVIERIHVETKPDDHLYQLYVYFYVIDITQQSEPEMVRVVIQQL